MSLSCKFLVRSKCVLSSVLSCKTFQFSALSLRTYKLKILNSFINFTLTNTCESAYKKMDLNRLSNEKKLNLCRWYFKVGCILLPFVWAVNALWFFREAFIKPPFDEQKQIKKYVIMSGAGAVVWVLLLITWVITFQVQRVSWGPMGDTLSFIVPLGRA